MTDIEAFIKALPAIRACILVVLFLGACDRPPDDGHHNPPPSHVHLRTVISDVDGRVRVFRDDAARVTCWVYYPGGNTGAGISCLRDITDDGGAR